MHVLTISYILYFKEVNMCNFDKTLVVR